MHLTQFEEYKPKSVRVLRQLYADDLRCRVESSVEASDTYNKARSILAQAGFNLHKWKCNSKDVLSKINELDKNETVHINQKNVNMLQDDQT